MVCRSSLEDLDCRTNPGFTLGMSHASMVRIEILAGPEAGRVVEMTPGLWRVGRAKENEIVLAVESVSSRHLQLTVGADGSVRFKDLGSTNGTFSAGVQVQEGEWFAGTEIRLGGCALKLLSADESGLLAEAKADDASAGARAAALSGPRRSSAPLLLAGVLLLGIAGAGGWWFFLRDTDAHRSRPGEAAGGSDPAAVQDVRDLLGGLGQFEDGESWQLSGGLLIHEGSLTTQQARGRATLLRNFDLTGGGVTVDAAVEGVAAQAVISFGADADHAVTWASWTTKNLGQGPVEFALPEGASWFQIALDLEGSGSVSNLRVESLNRSVAASSVPPGRLFLAGGNLLLMSDEQTVLAASSRGGDWTASATNCVWSGDTALTWTLGAGPVGAGGGLLLADGGPVGIAPGVRVEASPGLLLGADPRRLLVRCAPAAIFQCAESTLRSEGARSVTLDWDLGPALTEAARLTLEMDQAIRDGDDPRLLAVSARLLRELPLDERKIQSALTAQRAALERGEARLLELQAAVSAAMLVRSVDMMERQAQRAEDLATTYAGSHLGEVAHGLAGALRDAVTADRQAEQVAEAEWRGRLQAALAASYPAIAGWISRQDESATGGNR